MEAVWIGIGLAVLVAYVVIMRWVLPRLGIRT